MHRLFNDKYTEGAQVQNSQGILTVNGVDDSILHQHTRQINVHKLT